MTAREIIDKVRALNLPKKSYIVFGSCPLAIAGIREANDIDLYLTPEAYEVLKARGWRELKKGPRDVPIVYDVFEAHNNWNFGKSYNPTLTELQATATIIEDVPFASLEEVRKWKISSGRPKDLTDVELIDKYLLSAM